MCVALRRIRAGGQSSSSVQSDGLLIETVSDGLLIETVSDGLLIETVSEPVCVRPHPLIPSAR